MQENTDPWANITLLKANDRGKPIPSSEKQKNKCIEVDLKHYLELFPRKHLLFFLNKLGQTSSIGVFLNNINKLRIEIFRRTSLVALFHLMVGESDEVHHEEDIDDRDHSFWNKMVDHGLSYMWFTPRILPDIIIGSVSIIRS